MNIGKITQARGLTQATGLLIQYLEADDKAHSNTDQTLMYPWYTRVALPSRKHQPLVDIERSVFVCILAISRYLPVRLQYVQLIV
jgi:hypothetical protein